MMFLSNPFSIKGSEVFWLHIRVPKADASSFRHLGGDWGQDARHVFVQAKLKKVDFDTFQFLNSVFVKDSHSAYDWKGPIKTAEAASFEILDPGVHIDDEIVPMIWARGYGRDRKSVFYHDQSMGRATALRGVDPKSFISLRNDYGCDQCGVWFQKSRLPDADPKSWMHLGHLWSADSKSVYYAERVVPDIVRESFTIIGGPSLGIFATDTHRFFMTDIVVDERNFWNLISKNLASLEQRLQGAYQRLRGNCTTCEGTGNCYCQRKGQDTATCERCVGTGQCHVCQGLGRVKCLRQF